MKNTNSSTIAKKIATKLKSIPNFWEGKGAILEMKETGFSQWRQMEWAGFYFQFLCGKYLSETVKIPGPKYNNAEFDGFLEIPWDFKAHAINTSAHEIIVNDSQATAEAIKNYGSVGLILALGEVFYNDKKRSFQRWHQKLKGGKTKYEIKRIERGAWSRLRKTSFDLKQICFIEITDKTLIKCGLFQVDFRNSNGKPRNAKVLIDLEKLDNELLYRLNF